MSEQQEAQEAKDTNISKLLFDRLQNELGGEKFADHQYVTKIYDLRNAMAPTITENRREDAARIVRESALWEDYQEIQQERFSNEELEQIADLDTDLRSSNNTAYIRALTDALSQFVAYRHELSWDKRPAQAKGNETQKTERVNRAVKHIIDVADMTQKIKTSPIASLLALIHDVEKYAGEVNLLGEHEVASAVVGGEILEALCNATQGTQLDLQKYAPTLKKLARKVFTHGEFEFPDLNATQVTDKPEDKDIRILFPNAAGGVNLKPLESGTIPLAENLPESEKASAGSNIARESLELVSVADKIVGMKDLDKVLGDTIGTDYEKSTEWERMDKVTNTIIENEIASQMVYPVPEDSVAYKERQQYRDTNLLIVFCIKTSDELSKLDPAERKAKRLEIKAKFEAALGDRGNELFDYTEFQSQAFRSKSQQNKQLYVQLFNILFKNLHEHPIQIPKDSVLHEEFQQTEKELTEKWLTLHPQLLKK